MRQAILRAAVMAVCVAAQAGAQSTPKRLTPLLPRIAAHGRGKIAAKDEPRPAIIFDASGLGSSLVLDNGWRVGISSDSSAALADYDDSGWATRSATAFMEDVPEEDAGTRFSGAHVKISEDDLDSTRVTRYAWFRMHIKLAPNHGPVALLIELPVSQNTSIEVGSSDASAEVFANGQRITPEGPHGSTLGHYQQISRVYDLKVDPSVTSLTLVLRTLYVPFGSGAYTSFFASRTVRLGNRADLDRELTLWQNRNLFERLPKMVYSIVLIVLAGFLLALYFSQKGHLEYLWLALHELVQSPIGFVELAGSSAKLDSLWFAALVLQLLLASAYLFFEFLVAFLALKRRWYIRWLRYTAPVLALVGPTLLLVGHGRIVGLMLAIGFVGSFLWLVVWSIFVFVTLIAASVRRNFEAGLLLVPLVLGLIGIVEPLATASLSEMRGTEVRSPLTLHAGAIPIHFASIADFTGILVIVIIIFVRFLRINRDQQRASSELAAARSVQELMIPQEKLATPGFEVESVYTPANEVGGDFFHVESVGDGGMLVVIGDVAGKGLKAAMNVSMLMGALRRTPDLSPARILDSLNRVLAGSESFTTCQAVLFKANGEVVLANAGHLPPYLNSQEIEVPGGLPLGVLDESSYEEIRFYLHPGDRLLLLSDGVVEARRPSGELFGFERLQNLSNQSAFYLAEAAKSFGQEDDITVLTVRRLAQTMAA